jgi:hypothetical protein
MTVIARVRVLVIASLIWAGAAVLPIADAADYTVVPGHIDGTNWNSHGTWKVDYQRLAGGDPTIAGAMNEVIDAEAGGIVAATDHAATDRKPWTFSATGTMHFYSISIAALFTGVYQTDLPNMPFQSVATRVFDGRSGAQITWDNLFTDKLAGLVRLSDETRAILPTVYKQPSPRGLDIWSQSAANELNFKAWIPTTAGIELHFGDFQFGRGLPVITVSWSKVADLIAPEFAILTA